MRISSGDWFLLIFSGFWGLAMGAFPSSVQIGECVCVCVWAPRTWIMWMNVPVDVLSAASAPPFNTSALLKVHISVSLCSTPRCTLLLLHVERARARAHTHTRTHTHLTRFVSAGWSVSPGALRHCSRSEQQSVCACVCVCVCVFPMQAACALTAVNTLADPVCRPAAAMKTSATVPQASQILCSPLFFFFFFCCLFLIPSPVYSNISIFAFSGSRLKKKKWWTCGFHSSGRQIGLVDLEAWGWREWQTMTSSCWSSQHS